MILHIVLFGLKDEALGQTKAQNIEKARELAANFMADIPELKSFELKTNKEGSPAGNEDLAVICTVDSWEDLAAYNANPTHQAFVRFISQVRERRHAIDTEL